MNTNKDENIQNTNVEEDDRDIMTHESGFKRTALGTHQDIIISTVIGALYPRPPGDPIPIPSHPLIGLGVLNHSMVI